MSIEQILENVKNTFNFEVSKFPLSGPENMKTPFYGLFRSDNSNVVGRAVTSRYTPHQTDDVLALVEASSTAFEGVAEVKCGFRDGHYLAIMPSKETRKAIYGTQDNVFPRVMINAGYDGKAFKACMGYYRDLCKNMSMLRQVTGTTVSIRHTSGLRPKMNELIATFNTLKNSWANLEQVIQNLESRQLNMVEFLKAVYGEPTSEGRSATIHKNRTEAIFNRLMSERMRSGRPDIGTDWKVSGWEAFNAIQGYVQHETSRHGSNNDMDRIILANNDPIVQKAEQIAFQMAV